VSSVLTVCSRPAGFGQQAFALLDQLKEFLELDSPALKPNHLIFVLGVYKSCESLLLTRLEKLQKRFEFR